MPRLYVANVTKQLQIVYFRLDVNPDGTRDPEEKFRLMPKSQAIRPGQQAPLGGELLAAHVATVMLQLQKYGLIEESAVRRHRGKFTLICSDRPISAETIRYADDRNQGIKEQEGRTRRQKAAVAANTAVAQRVLEDPTIAAPPREFDLSYEQDEQTEAGEKTVAEGYTVDVKAPPAAAPPTTPRGARRKSA